jgi:thiosulfate dehydrogenase [quinone] large subunit
VTSLPSRAVGEDERTLLVLAGARILLGVLWLANLAWKLPPDFGRDDPEGLLYSFELAADHAVVEPLRTLAADVLIPHFTLFGWLVFLVELVVGLSLALGLWTRIGALLSVVQAIVITLLVVRAPDEWVWTYVLLIALSLVVALTPSGARLSLDARLERRG